MESEVVQPKIRESSEARLAAQSSFQRLILRSFSESKIRNPSYSLRSFAKKLRMSPSALSEIMAGKRDVSGKMVDRILLRLELDPEEVGRIKQLFTTKKADDKSELDLQRVVKYEELESDKFRMISDWHHFAVLTLLETDDCDGRVETIAKRLGIRRQEVEVAVERLERLGLAAPNEKNILKPTFKQLTTSDGVANVAVRAAHAQYLEGAKRSLEVDDVSVRDFRSVMLAIDPKKLPAARKLIRQFQDEFSRFMESGEKKEVYQILINFFPLSTPNRASTEQLNSQGEL